MTPSLKTTARLAKQIEETIAARGAVYGPPESNFASGLSVRRTSTMGEHEAALSWARAAQMHAARLEARLEPRSIQHPPYSHPGDVA